jgi:hypothetical protein
MATGAVKPPARRSEALKVDKLGVGKVPVVTQTHIADPSTGATVDSQARTAINAILDVLEAFGLTATS